MVDDVGDRAGRCSIMSLMNEQRLAAASCDNRVLYTPLFDYMTVPNDAFRRFQEELAAIDRKEHLPIEKPTGNQRLTNAKADFLSLRKRYGLSVADVVAFFPEEEGIAYLQALIAAREGKITKKRAKVD